jgi:hypothetical protein
MRVPEIRRFSANIQQRRNDDMRPNCFLVVEINENEVAGGVGSQGTQPTGGGRNEQL